MTKNQLMTTCEFELREFEGENKLPKLVGYALKFDQPSRDMGFVEYLDRDCLNGADMSNTVALINHDNNLVLGKVGRNMTLTVDEIGLKFEIEPLDIGYVRDLISNMRAGLIDKCSFAFSVESDVWEEVELNVWERHIKQIKELYDVSIVTNPAYLNTEAVVANRGLAEAKSMKRQREIEVMKLKHSI